MTILDRSSIKDFSSRRYVSMTSLSVQKRAKPQPTQAVCRSRKNLAALGVDFKKSSTLVSEISITSLIVYREYRVPPNLSLRWRKEGLQCLFFQTVRNADQIVRFQDLDPFPASFNKPLPFPIAEQATDSEKCCAGHLRDVLPRERQNDRRFFF
jgi:hypothetical protein